MLLQMRKFTRSWISYVLLFILSALFVIVLGNGQSLFEMFQTTISNNVATGRGVTIDQNALEREFAREMRIARQQNEQDAGLDRQQAVERGMHTKAFEKLIQREAVNAYLDRLQLRVSDRDLDAAISESPIALNPLTRSYDAAALERNLSEINMSYEEFRRWTSGEISAGVVARALNDGVRPPSSFAKMLFALQTESRVVSLAQAPASALGALGQPTAAEVEQFWRDNPSQWRVPEYRALTVVLARPENFAAAAVVPEDVLQAEIAARSEAGAQPERRTYVRVNTPTEAAAREAAQRLSRGEDHAAIAAALGNGVLALQGEKQARAEVPDARVAEAVFAAQRGVASVAQGRLGWAAFRVDAIEEAVGADADAIRREAREAVVSQLAGDAMNSALDEFEAARDSGASVAEAARSAGLEVTAVAGIDQANRNPEGALVGLPPPLLRAAFAAEQGEVSDRIALGSTEAWVAVDRITPATLRPLDEVRADVVSGWTAQKRQQRLQALGQSVVQAIANGQTLPEAARANRMSVVASSQELQRSAFAAANPQGLAARIPPDLAQEIFAARQGGVVSAVNPEAEAVWVAIVEEIRRTDPASNPQAVQDIRARLEFDCRPGQNRPPPCLRASLADAVEADMVGAANVRRNPDRLRAMFGLSQNREGEGAQ